MHACVQQIDPLQKPIASLRSEGAPSSAITISMVRPRSRRYHMCNRPGENVEGEGEGGGEGESGGEGEGKDEG